MSERLLSTVSADEPPTLYWSQADPAGLVLGFSQKQDILNPAALAAQQLPIYHRRAGGSAVMVGPGFLRLGVMLPANHSLGLPDIVVSYRWLVEAWAAAPPRPRVYARPVAPGRPH